MRKFWYNAALLLMAVSLSTMTACDDDDDEVQSSVSTSTDDEDTTDDEETTDDEDTTDEEETTTVTITEGVYIINTGNYNANNGSIQWYDPADETISEDLFETANGKGIGDAQDLIVYGSKVYITCSSSAKIEIVNREDFSIAETINLANDEGEAIKARYLTADGGYVYFTAYDGTVNKIDTASLAITESLELGEGTYPEALSAANGKLYINISGYGSGNTIAVVDIASFTLTGELEVALDPYDVNFLADDGKVYFTSMGDYGYTTCATLQCIDPETDEVTTICNASKAAVHDGKIYFISADYYSSDPGVIGVYDTATGSSSTFADYDSFTGSPQFIAVDPVSGDVYIGNYSYSSLNDVYVYSSDGEFMTSFETGWYTTNVRFVTTETTVTE